MEWLRSIGLLAIVFVGACTVSRGSRSAGQIGCTPDEITISNDEAEFGVIQSGETWVAECQGRTFVCSQINQSGKDKSFLDMMFAAEQVSCHQAPESPIAEQNRHLREAALVARANRPATPPPTGAAGFDFGETPESVASRCEAAGQAWREGNATASNRGDKGRPGCSGAATALGIPARVDFEFCDGRACSITLEHVPPSNWSRSLVSLKAKLETKYGSAHESSGIVPEWCRSETAFKGCLESQQVALRYTWRWAGGESIEMSVGKRSEADNSAVRLVYRRLGGANVSAL